MSKSLRSTLIWRGVLALIVGGAAVGWPSVTVGAFVLLFAAYAFLAAGLDLVMAFRADRAGPVVGRVLLAVLSAATGVLALAWPGLTVLVFTLIVAGWAFATGVVEVYLAFRRGSGAGERAMWALGGLVSIALAVVLVLRPDIGALSLATVFGLFGMIYGITMLTHAAQAKKLDAAVSQLVMS
jgi:uncharacterized membrane protein HdeD (DUF308 family)